jgi:thiol peroxidase
VVVDTSNAAAFGGTHIKGSYSIWLAGLPAFAGWVLSYDKPILLVLEDQCHLERAVRYLIRLGYDRIQAYLKGGIEGWYNAGFPTEHVQLLSVQQLKAKIDRGEELTVVDDRGEDEWGGGHIKGARHIYVGQKAPDFRLLATDMSEVELWQSRGKVRLLSVVTSLDTPVCDLQTQRFEEEAGKLRDVIIYTISMDLPFAQARYCGAHNIKDLQTLSDHRDASFGTAYGVLIKELRLLRRAVFIINRNDTVRYVEYVREVTQHPDYDMALKALNKVVSGG